MPVSWGATSCVTIIHFFDILFGCSTIDVEKALGVCLFAFRLYVPVYNSSIVSGRFPIFLRELLKSEICVMLRSLVTCKSALQKQIIFLFLNQNKCFGYSKEPSQ